MGLTKEKDEERERDTVFFNPWKVILLFEFVSEEEKTYIFYAKSPELV